MHIVGSVTFIIFYISALILLKIGKKSLIDVFVILVIGMAVTAVIFFDQFWIKIIVLLLIIPMWIVIIIPSLRKKIFKDTQ